MDVVWTIGKWAVFIAIAIVIIAVILGVWDDISA
jgi:hypothetical protein